MPDYEAGKIYGITDTRDGECIYVGATCNQLCSRWGNHRSIVVHGHHARNGSHQLVHRYMRKNGVFNFGIFEIETCPCSGRAALREREQQVVAAWRPRFFNAYSMVLAKTRKAGRAAVQCECGCVVTKAGLAGHRRTAKHASRSI